MEENEEACRLFGIVCNQVIVGGMGDIIDINLDAVISIMAVHGIRDKKDCLDKIRDMFAMYKERLSLMREE